MFPLLKHKFKVRRYVHLIGYHWDVVKKKRDLFLQDINRSIDFLDDYIDHCAGECAIWGLVYMDAYFEVAANPFSKLRRNFYLVQASYYQSFYCDQLHQSGKLKNAFYLCKSRIEQACHLLSH
mgnify:CR=1 FL=1